MIKRKNNFLAFCFSLLPGAGHMYLGFIKHGVSLMTLFFGSLFIAIYLNIGALSLFLPIIVCYSFFDTINKNSLSDQDFYALEDKYVFDIEADDFKKLLQGKFRPAIALILIIIGIQLLFSNLYSLLLTFLPSRFSNLLYHTLLPLLNRLPQLLIGLFIIALGLRLIRGKKINLDLEDPKCTEEEDK